MGMSKEKEMRCRRDIKLKATDVYMLSDFPITQERRAEIISYRQALRNMPEQEGFPDVPWPEKPVWLE